MLSGALGRFFSPRRAGQTRLLQRLAHVGKVSLRFAGLQIEKRLLQKGDFSQRFLFLLQGQFLGGAGLAIAFEIFLGVLGGGQGRVQGDFQAAALRVVKIGQGDGIHPPGHQIGLGGKQFSRHPVFFHPRAGG